METDTVIVGMYFFCRLRAAVLPVLGGTAAVGKSSRRSRRPFTLWPSLIL